MTQEIDNLFRHRTAAARYAFARPYFHPLVVDRIAAFADQRFERALDVACGTGQSSRALTEIADAVDAVDMSPQMIGEAEPHPSVSYAVAPAEDLPFNDQTFDLVTVGLAFHWFDQAAFLAEAQRVLKDAGWLVLYNSWFTGSMVEDAEFESWLRGRYLTRYPTPPRRAMGADERLAESRDFDLVETAVFEFDECMSRRRLADYLSTQSNAIAAVEEGDDTVEGLVRWIEEATATFFSDSERTFRFGGKIWYLRRKPFEGQPREHAPFVTTKNV